MVKRVEIFTHDWWGYQAEEWVEPTSCHRPELEQGLRLSLSRFRSKKVRVLYTSNLSHDWFQSETSVVLVLQPSPRLDGARLLPPSHPRP